MLPIRRNLSFRSLKRPSSSDGSTAATPTASTTTLMDAETVEVLQQCEAKMRNDAAEYAARAENDTGASDVRASLVSSTRSNSVRRFSAVMEQQGFTLNKLNFNGLGRLYGREKEVELLLQVFDRSKNKDGKTQVLMLSGPSGSGKSVLARELKRPVIKDGGYFLEGKFDLQNQGEPYSAFITALDQLCDDILDLETTNENKFYEEREKIRNAVAGDGRVQDMVPNLRLLLEDKSEPVVVSSSSQHASGAREKNRLLFVLRRVFRVISNPARPVVLLLEDLQWVDVGSLALMKTLVSDNDMAGFILLGCYCENEVDCSTHPLGLFFRELDIEEEDSRVNISHVTVANLDEDAVSDLLVDLLKSNRSETAVLARILQEKTYGNAFFVIQFLISLRNRHLLKFNMASLSWDWDIEQISSLMDVTDNVAELMEDDILNSLSGDAMKVLQMAACLGSTFEEDTLLVVAEKVNETDTSVLKGASLDKTIARQCLALCVEKGFVLRNKNSSGAIFYRFAHDVVQKAAFSLIPDRKQSRVQVAIGKTLVKNLSAEELGRNLFVAVDLINKETDVGDERSFISKLNLYAGRKAMTLVAFEPAIQYFRKGIDLLGVYCWDDAYYTESLELFSHAADAEKCIGNIDASLRFCRKVLAHSKGPLEEKLPTYITLVEALSSQENNLEALNTSLSLLRQLGVRIPPEWSLKAATAGDFVITKAALRGKSMEDLCHLPAMDDTTKIMAMKLMDHSLNDCYILNSEYFSYLISTMVRWSVKYGVCPHSAPAFTTYGLILASSDHLKEANEFARVGLALSKRPGFNDTRSRVLMHSQGHTGHWTRPLNSGMKPLLEGHEVGLRTGDLENAFFNAYFYLLFIIILGRPLAQVDEACRDFARQMKRYNMQHIYIMSMPQWQFVLNMMGESNDPMVLSGEAMDLDAVMKHLEETNFIYTIDVVRTLQLYLAFYFGDYELAWKMVEASKNTDKSNVAQPTVWRRAFFVGLTAFSLARTTDNVRVWRGRANSEVKRMKKWVSRGSVNCVHLLHLFEAENLDLCGGRDEEARRMFDIAVSTAARSGFIQDRALANERAAEFCIRIDDMQRGADYLSLAHHYYLEWGAEAKASNVRQKMATLLGHEFSI